MGAEEMVSFGRRVSHLHGAMERSAGLEANKFVRVSAGRARRRSASAISMAMPRHPNSTFGTAKRSE